MRSVEFGRDVHTICEHLIRYLGVATTFEEAEQLWSLYSMDQSAGWICVPRDREELVDRLRAACRVAGIVPMPQEEE